jgi:putative transposase
MPARFQTAVIAKYGAPSAETMPALAPEAALAVVDLEMNFPSLADAAFGRSRFGELAPADAPSLDDLRDPRVRKIMEILRDAENVPRGWTRGKRKWVEAVALRHDTQWQSIYRWQKKYDQKGLAGLRHTKGNAGKPRVWTEEAVDWWVGVCLKRENRKMDRKDLYEHLVVEARRRGWMIGTYESANWWYEQRATPGLRAYSRGGLRALDNMLPPVLRDYSDLAPFEILVGDQHRFDFWVVDDESGAVFRPEAYLWQDLRTRILYGGAIDRRYDAWLIGMALRIGINAWGAFGSIYTDNGKPELSRYVTGILADMRSLGLGWQQTVDVPGDLLDVDEDEVNPLAFDRGTHHKAIVKNAKAKMIEGTNAVFEGILRSHFRLPGSVKRLTDETNAQEIDHEEAMALARQGKLLLRSEFTLAFYRTMDFYNRERVHRGVLREWAWKPRPATATPLDCLRACYADGWRPQYLSAEAVDLVFMAKASRKINQGRITFENELWEHGALCGIEPGTSVELRYNPMTTDELHVFQGRRYLCTALPVERSSMKDQGLAERKIHEKRTRRRAYVEEFRLLTARVPDFREYSQVPAIERPAALIEDNRRQRAAEQIEANRVLSQEELDARVEKLEQGLPAAPKERRALPERPGYFLDDFARFEWVMGFVKAGGALSPEDEAFKGRYLAEQTPGQREYYEFVLAEAGQ